MVNANTHGEEGSSRRVAEISASIIWPGVISIGIPRPGVLGRGGELTFEYTIIVMNINLSNTIILNKNIIFMTIISIGINKSAIIKINDGLCVSVGRTLTHHQHSSISGHRLMDCTYFNMR